MALGAKMNLNLKRLSHLDAHEILTETEAHLKAQFLELASCASG
jgi:hypothetical protein